MTPENVLDTVRVAIDRLTESSEPYNGLFPSLLDRETGEMLTEMPEPIPGQRNWDRAHLGSNLIHDEPLLQTMYALAAAGDSRYAAAADRYLEYFATRCTDTTTGLFPWGEHAFWHLGEDRIGNSVDYHPTAERPACNHDHLRQVPLRVWEKLHEYDPKCVQRFADGLEYHWTDPDRTGYNRHAPISERFRRDSRSDFPRHGGHYLFDWSVAYRYEQRETVRDQIETMLDYWWENRNEWNLLSVTSTEPDGEPLAPAQTLSLAASLLEAADLLEAFEPGIAERMRERASGYVDGFATAPHDPDDGLFLDLCRRRDLEDGEFVPWSDPDVAYTVAPMSVWGSEYGSSVVAPVGLTCLCAWRYLRDDRLLEWAKAAGRQYRCEPFPADGVIPASDPGTALGLLADLYDVTGNDEWLTGGLALADTVVDAYFDAEIPRGATGIDWYESQMGPAFLLHGLARTALLACDGSGCPLGPNYTAR